MRSYYKVKCVSGQLNDGPVFETREEAEHERESLGEDRRYYRVIVVRMTPEEYAGLPEHEGY